MKPRQTAGANARKATQTAECAAVKCPYAEAGSPTDRCAECPGPAYFRSHHSCHKCALDGKGDPRCGICAGPSDEPNHKGASHVYIDGLEQGASEAVLEGAMSARREGAPAAGPEADPEAAVEEYVRAEAEEAARRVLHFFAALDIGEFAIVKHLLAGGNLNTYALVNNRTRQDVWKQAIRAMRRLPELRAIVKERRQANGRAAPAARRENPMQMTLF